MNQLSLPFADPTDRRYVRGFRAGFVTLRDEQPPPALDYMERVGWLDGQAGVQVPEHRWTTLKP